MTPTREVTPTWEWPSWPVAPAACTCGRRDAGVAGGTGKSEESPNEITPGLADYRVAAAWVRSLTTAFWRGKFIAHLLDIVSVPWPILRSGDWPVTLMNPPYWGKYLLAFLLPSESGLCSSRAKGVLYPNITLLCQAMYRTWGLGCCMASEWAGFFTSKDLFDPLVKQQLGHSEAHFSPIITSPELNTARLDISLANVNEEIYCMIVQCLYLSYPT